MLSQRLLILSTLLTLLFVRPVSARVIPAETLSPAIPPHPGESKSIHPHIIAENNLYTMWYVRDTGSGSVLGYAQSANGSDWHNYQTASLMYTRYVGDPFTFIENNQYTTYFSVSTDQGIRIWKNTSEDGYTFTPERAQVVLEPQSGEGNSVSCPSVIKVNNMYYMTYSSNGPSGWSTGMAYSIDSHTWTRCPTNPIISPGVSAQMLAHDGKTYIYYGAHEGIYRRETDEFSGCDTVWQSPTMVTQNLMDVSPVIDSEGDVLIYGTSWADNRWSVASLSLKTRQLSYPVVLIPGFFASWNSDALLHNSIVPADQWKLNPMVTEYNEVQRLFAQVGMQKDTDWYLFAYDWRKPIDEITHDLDQFLERSIWSKKPLQDTYIVGHSLGGLIARIYSQKYSDRPVHKVVSTGAPHQGVLQSYRPLIAGEIDRENTLLWYSQKLLLYLNRTSLFQSDRDVIRAHYPVLYDLLPVYPFLRITGELTFSNEMRNDLLNTYSFQSWQPPDGSRTFAGSGTQTPFAYELTARSPLSVIGNTYGDGDIAETLTQDGDSLVPLVSAADALVYSANHGQTIYGKTHLAEIMSAIDHPVNSDLIQEGSPTTLSPSLLFLIRSPATFTVTANGSTWTENDGTVFIPHADQTTYDIEVVGTETGEYTLHLWAVSQSDDQWFTFSNTTTQGKKDKYQAFFSEATPATMTFISPTPTSSPPTGSSSNNTTPPASSIANPGNSSAPATPPPTGKPVSTSSTQPARYASLPAADWTGAVLGAQYPAELSSAKTPTKLPLEPTPNPAPFAIFLLRICIFLFVAIVVILICIRFRIQLRSLIRTYTP